MNEAELLTLLRHHEADSVELTVATKDTDKFSEAVCAFANDLPRRGRPGHLVIGADDAGRIAGITITDELLRNLGGLRSDGQIQPMPSIVVEKVSTSRGDVAVVTVQPSHLPPVRYRGRIWIRIGPRKGVATEQEERQLIERRVSQARTFDAQPCIDAGLEDLATGLFANDYRQHAIAAEVIAENHRPIEHQLASLRFFDAARDCPTNAGVLLFGLDVTRWLPGAYVQFLRVAGDSLAAPVSNDRVLRGDLLTVLRELDALVDATLTQQPAELSTLREEMIASYPRVAVRELLLNAIMHRDYAATAPLRITWLSDRLEIQSPGGLYGEATPANFPQQTSYRNPVLAEALKNLGYVNRYGRGVLRAQDALRRNGSRPAEFRFDSGFVLATVWERT
ncbi:MAG: putative DNA binding domain-containing protein [Planctomycetes bacterium]|jgi:ATP-dependent DNA helicase RecG|nr:putative DNA binding domain-containing protein [Planctomycetota bacterium]